MQNRTEDEPPSGTDIRMLPHHRYLSPTEPLHRDVPSAIGYCERCSEYCDGGERGGFSCTCCDNRQEWA